MRIRAECEHCGYKFGSFTINRLRKFWDTNLSGTCFGCFRESNVRNSLRVTAERYSEYGRPKDSACTGKCQCDIVNLMQRGCECGGT